MKLSEKLDQMNACQEAVDWIGRRGLMTSWRDCKRADWMLWAAVKLNIDKKLIVLAACDCAETALQYVPDGEDRPARAVQTSRNWCNGTATRQECRKAAADAAHAAAHAAHAARRSTRAICADLVRQRMPFLLIKKAWKLAQ